MFYIGVAVWIALIAPLALWWVRSQMHYIRLYKARRDHDLPSIEEHSRSFYKNPLRQQLKVPSLLLRYFRILSEPQDDPELEEARRRANFRYNILLAVAFGGVVIPIIFEVLGVWLGRRLA